MPWNPDAHIESEKLIRDFRFNQLTDWMKSHEMAAITAWRSVWERVNDPSKTLLDKPIDGSIEERTYSKEENRKRNSFLSDALLYKSYGIAKIDGNYTEDGGTPETERSFFVVNRYGDSGFKEIMVTLGEWFNQDTILYKPAGSEDAYLIDTNGPNVGRERNIGKFLEHVASEYADRVRNKLDARASSISHNQIRRFERMPVEERKPQRIEDDKVIWPISCDDWILCHGVMGAWGISLRANGAVRDGLLPNIFSDCFSIYFNIR